MDAIVFSEMRSSKVRVLSAMSGATLECEMGDESKRHNLVPLVVGSLSIPDPTGGAQHPPFAMLLTVDVDTVPGFRDVLSRQLAGEEFDVFARWAAEIDEGGGSPPQVVLDFYLPELELGISIYIDVDRHPESIQVAIQTGRVIVIDPELSVRLQQEEEIGTALDELRVFSVEPPDPSPLIGVLQQRFDFPREAYEPERHALTPETSAAAAEKFVADGRIVTGAGVCVRGDGPASIVLVDPESGPIAEKIPTGAKVEGRWGVIAAAEHSVLAFDAVAEDEHIGRWLIADPPEELVRTGSNGAHAVAVLTELSPDDQEETDRHWGRAIHAWVPHVEALRALRLKSA
jgi:hypothetical protein